MGALLCSAGYLAVVLILESTCVPPLRSPANYGQFGLLLISSAFFGLLVGASFALIPYTRFVLWMPFFVVITLTATSGNIAAHFDPTEVTCTAMLMVGALIVALAFLTSSMLARYDLRST